MHSRGGEAHRAEAVGPVSADRVILVRETPTATQEAVRRVAGATTAMAWDRARVPPRKAIPPRDPPRVSLRAGPIRLPPAVFTLADPGQARPPTALLRGAGDRMEVRWADRHAGPRRAGLTHAEVAAFLAAAWVDRREAVAAASRGAGEAEADATRLFCRSMVHFCGNCRLIQ